jgi:Clp amino terminal domain, pathogenicity island component
MMFERFTDDARQTVVQAQHNARRLGHNYIGCEHLLLAVAAAGEPASAVLRDQGVTPERVEAEILRVIGPGHAAGVWPGLEEPGQAPVPADPLAGLDREALAAIGIDLDVVRAHLEAAFGPDALTRAITAHKRAAQACRRRRRPAWGKGPLARLMHHQRSRRGPTSALAPHFRGPQYAGPPSRGGHIPFTPRAKKSLELSLREAVALKDTYIGVQHLALALLLMKDGMVPAILSALGASRPSLRAAILDRYRKAS